MMTAEENDLLTRVEGDAPMGRLMRRYWFPACLSEELPEPDGEPIPVRLLGEDLVAWRDTDGQVALMDRNCPHRRASLVFGRNEENGLRCLYHGWKMDVQGNVVEMPSEPRESVLAQKVKIKTYPTREAGGIVWTYMGAPETMPEFTAPPFAPTPGTRVSIVKILIDCNWAQCLEGNIDSAHSSSLHSSNVQPAKVGGTQINGLISLRPTTDKSPRMQVQRTAYGFKYAAIRRPIHDAHVNDYVRMTLFVAPFTALIPPNNLYGSASVNVPIDDTHTAFHFIAWSDQPGGGLEQEFYRKRAFAQVGVQLDERYRKKAHVDNRYFQDRQAMKAGDFTGFKGTPNQDIPMWETMGPVADRTLEKLGASDIAIVEFRRLMVEAARRQRDGDAAAADLAPDLQVPFPEPAALRSFEGMLPKGAEWRHFDTLEAQEKYKAEQAFDAAAKKATTEVSAAK